MNPKWTVWLGGALLAAVIAAAIYLPALRRQVNKAKDLTEKNRRAGAARIAARGPREHRGSDGEGEHVLGFTRPGG